MPSSVMCGMDEVRGINRDSRSRRLGMVSRRLPRVHALSFHFAERLTFFAVRNPIQSNGRIFAHAMNKLAACVHSAAAANNVKVSPLFWADMVSPLHNGGTYGYQESFGGYAGNSSLAIQYLDPSITLVPWCVIVMPTASELSITMIAV